MSELVTRITRILDTATADPGVIDNVDISHKIIREMGLGECDVEDCRCRHHYVTDWVSDD